MDLKLFSKEQQFVILENMEQWKEEYSGNVYSIKINDDLFVYRGMSKTEYTIARDNYEDSYDANDYVFRTCVLYPEVTKENIDSFSAGAPEMLAEEILRISGFKMSADEFDVKLEKEEQVLESFIEQMPLVIKSVFTEMTLKEIEDWQFEKIIKYYVRAKWILEVIEGKSLQREEA